MSGNKFLTTDGLSRFWSKLKTYISNLYAPLSRKINNKDLSTDITLTASDVGAAAASHTHNYAGSSSAGGAATSAATSAKWGGYTLSVVTALPASPDANTIYIVK